MRVRFAFNVAQSHARAGASTCAGTRSSACACADTGSAASADDRLAYRYRLEHRWTASGKCEGDGDRWAQHRTIRPDEQQW